MGKGDDVGASLPRPLWIADQVRNDVDDAGALFSPSPLIPLPSRERGYMVGVVLLPPLPCPSGLWIKSAMTDRRVPTLWILP